MTVHDKLDKLLAKAVITQMVLVGSFSGGTTIDVTSLENYQDLTAEDFIMIPTQIAIRSVGGSSGNGSGSANPTLTYNATTGKLSVSGAGISQASGNLTGTLYGNVYYIAK